MEQHSPEWFEARSGRFTGSRFPTLMSTGKGRDDLLKDLAWERWTGRAVETYSNAAMQRGTELEPDARNWYAFVTDQVVREFGFIVHPKLDYVGISPDGLVGDDGIVEIKCPGHRAHLETLECRRVPSRYRWQVQGQLWTTGRKWLDFVSYHPDHGGVILRVEPSEKDHAALEAACVAADAEVRKLYSLLEEQAA